MTEETGLKILAELEKINAYLVRHDEVTNLYLNDREERHKLEEKRARTHAQCALLEMERGIAYARMWNPELDKELVK